MNGFVIAAYVVILGTLTAYALYLRARGRALERLAQELAQGPLGPDTLAGTEDA